MAISISIANRLMNNHYYTKWQLALLFLCVLIVKGMKINQQVSGYKTMINEKIIQTNNMQQSKIRVQQQYTNSQPRATNNQMVDQNISCSIAYQNTNSTMNLGNCQDELYYLVVGIGTPPQYFNLQLDTGSNILWLPTVNANLLGFNASNSSSFKNTSQPYSISYVNGGNVQGTIGTDYVTFLNTSINVTSQIVFADTVNGLSLPNGVLGIVGMGFTSAQTQPNFLDLAYKFKQIGTNIFSLSLQNTSNNSFIMFNQLPESLTKNSLYSQVLNSFYWQLSLIGVTAGLYDLTQYAAEVAVIDSGTSLFYLNPQLTNQFIKTFLPSSLCNFTQGLNICNCSILPSLPTLKFIFPGVAVEIPPSQYVDAFGSTCYVHIYQVETPTPEVLLGDTLFMMYNITFDKNNGQIGFQGNTHYVGIFGNNNGFVISQFALLAFAILFFILLAIMLFCFSNYYFKPRNDLKQLNLKQRMTEQFQIGENKLQILTNKKNQRQR